MSVKRPTAIFEDEESDDNGDTNFRPSFGLGASRRSYASPSKSTSPPALAAEDDDDDYMNMAILEPTSAETPLQRRERLKREAAIRGRPRSKAELAEEERVKREEALSKSLLTDETSKGFRMMKAMGYKPDTTTNQPIKPVLKESRSGIGHDTEKKRKLVDELAELPAAKRVELTPEEYRERVRLESLAKRQEGQFHGAQKICERFAAEEAGDGVDKQTDPTFSQIKKTPILWRGLLHHRAMKALQARTRHDLLQSGPLVGNGSGAKLPGYVDPDMDDDDKRAIGEEETVLDDEWEDPELDEFEKKEAKDRLEGIVVYLRERWKYCFWCKYRYGSDEEMEESCPGLEEEDHD